MNRTKVAIGLFLIAILGVLGGRFGLPWVIERQVAAALDDHIAGLPDSTGARYAGLSLDYWNDELQLTELRLPVDLLRPGGAAPYATLVTVRDIRVDGYDWSALEAVFQTGNATADASPLVRQMSWSGIVLEGQADGEPLGGTGPGQLDGLNAVEFSPADGAVTSLGFDALILQDMVLTPSPAYLGGGENLVLRAELPSAVLTGWSSGGADSIVLTGLAATAATTSSADAEGVAEFAVENLAVIDWERGEPGTVGKISMTGLTEMLRLPDNIMAGQGPEVARVMEMQGAFRFSVESYELTELRYDPQVLVLWQSLIKILAEQEPASKPDPTALVGVLEAYLTIVERVPDLQTGIGHAELTGLAADFGEATSMTMDRLEIKEMFGLKGGSFEVSGITQKGTGDVSASIERYRGEIGDLSALPEWLRTVFGKPLAVDSLEKARAWAEGKSLAELVPVVDLGAFAMEGIDVVGHDGKPVRIDLFAIDRMRISEDGVVEMAFRMDGITAPPDAGAGLPPQAGMWLHTLDANGMDEVEIGSSVALRAGLGDKTGALSVGMTGKGLADTLIEVEMTGLDYETLRTLQPQHHNAWMMTSQLVKARIRVVDEGLRAMLLEVVATARQGSTGEMIGQQFGAFAEQMGASIGTPASRELGQQVAAFVTGGGTLEVTTELAEPLPLMRIIGLSQQPPAQIIEMFGVRASHSAP